MGRNETYELKKPDASDPNQKNQELKVGLGWSPCSCFGADVDAAAIAVNKEHKIIGRAVLGGSRIKGVTHGGDNLTGNDSNKDDDEVITVKLSELDDNVESIFFTASIFALCPLGFCCLPLATFLCIPTTRVGVSGVVNGEYYKFASATFSNDTLTCWERMSCHMIIGAINRRKDTGTGKDSEWDFISMQTPVKSCCTCLNQSTCLPDDALPRCSDLKPTTGSDSVSSAQMTNLGP